MRRSHRLPDSLEPSELSRAIAARRRADTLDLTVSNPTEAELFHDAAVLRAALGVEASTYAPSPLGEPAARAAVGRYAGVAAERVVLTASTSEAYAMVAKLLCDPGDA